MRTIIFFLSLWSASLVAADFPMIVDPVVNATPPGSKVTAGYLTLINKSDKNITITGAYSPTISQVEIHLSSIKNDVASMEKQDTVTIEAGETLAFTHGSYHLMLMQLTEPLKENDTVDIILTTSVGEMLIEMPVRKAGMSTHSEANGAMQKNGHTEMTGKESGDMNKSEHSEENSNGHGDMKKDGDAHTETTKVVR